MQERTTRATAELRDLIRAGVNIWDFDYPSYYQGEAKKAFEQKVIDHFYLRQIGAETVGRFLHYFRRTVREIMPYYIQRYESVDLMKDPEIRPLENYNMIEEYSAEGSENDTRTGESGGTTTSTGESTGTGSRDLTVTGKDTAVHSDTPQGQLNLTISADGSANMAYASDVTESANRETTGESSTAGETTTQEATTTGTSSETGTKASTDKHKLTRRGNIGVTTYAQLLEGYRETFLNIDMEVINELEICFLGVW